LTYLKRYIEFLAEHFLSRSDLSSVFFFYTFSFPHTFDRTDSRKRQINTIFTEEQKAIRKGTRKRTNRGTFRRCEICYAMRAGDVPMR